ncbi:hypothetical protein T11_17719, partial [Trichinella zimbabwensis]
LAVFSVIDTSDVLGKHFHTKPVSSALYSKSTLYPSFVIKSFNVPVNFAALSLSADNFSPWILSSRMPCRLLKFLSHSEQSTKLSILKSSAFSCKIRPLIGWSSARFWRNHMYTAKSSALFDAFFFDFREEQLLEVSMSDTKSFS